MINEITKSAQTTVPCVLYFGMWLQVTFDVTDWIVVTSNICYGVIIIHTKQSNVQDNPLKSAARIFIIVKVIWSPNSTWRGAFLIYDCRMNCIPSSIAKFVYFDVQYNSSLVCIYKDYSSGNLSTECILIIEVLSKLQQPII